MLDRGDNMNILLAGCILIASTTNHLQTIKASKSLTLRSKAQGLLVYRCPVKTHLETVKRLQSDGRGLSVLERLR